MLLYSSSITTLVLWVLSHEYTMEPTATHDSLHLYDGSTYFLSLTRVALWIAL